MTDKLFDDFFKQKLEQHDSGAPMHVWEKVRRELHEDDDDKGIAWWKNPLWLLALLLLIGGITTVGVVGSRSNWFGKQDNISVADKNENKINEKNIITADESTIPTEATNENKITAPGTNSLTIPVTTVAANDNKNTALITGNNDDVATSLNNTGTKNRGKRKLFIKSKFSRSSLIASSPSTGNQFARIISSNSNNNNNSTVTETDNNTLLSLTKSAPENASKSLLELQNIKTAIPFNPQAFSGCPTIGPPRRNDLYLEIYGAADNAAKSITGTSFTPVNYIDKRKEAEKSQVGFSAGIRIAKNLGERTLLKTGLNYSQINEQLKFINEKDIRTITVITTRTVTSGGQTITISDTTTVTQIGTSYNTYNNRYRTFDIPVIFSYEMGNSRKLSVGINAGVIVNIVSKYRGKILDTNLNLVPINTSNTLGVNAWRKNIGLGLYGSVSVYKRLNDKMQLFFEPYVRYNLNPVNVSETVIKQKYITTGLQVGVRYNLFHKRQRYTE